VGQKHATNSCFTPIEIRQRTPETPRKYYVLSYLSFLGLGLLISRFGVHEQAQACARSCARLDSIARAISSRLRVESLAGKAYRIYGRGR
jgi:hypothetical protein